MRRITCNDLALGFACSRVIQSETDDDLLDQAVAHAREEHGLDRLDREHARTLIVADAD